MKGYTGAHKIADSGGAIIDPATEPKQDDIITALDGITIVSRTPASFLDDDFVAGDSPAILDVNTALGQNGREFNLINDGAGDFTVSISNDGVAFGDEQLVQNGEIYVLDNVSIDTIRITHVQNSGYRVFAI